MEFVCLLDEVNGWDLNWFDMLVSQTLGRVGVRIASFKLPARRSRYDTDHRRNDKNDKRAGVDAEHIISSLCY